MATVTLTCFFLLEYSFMVPTLPWQNRAFVSFVEAQSILGNISRRTLYARIGSGELRSVKSGRRALIPVGVLKQYIKKIDPQSNVAA